MHFSLGRSRLSSGFTMVELMVVVAIVGILTAVAVPSFTSYLARQQLRDQTSAFARAVNLARVEAVKRGRNVMVCRSNAPEALPRPACGTHAGNWASGWVVFADDNNNGAIDATETVIRVQPGWTNSGIINSNGNGRLRFRPNGIGTGMEQTFTFRPKTAGTTANVTVTLSANGRWTRS